MRPRKSKLVNGFPAQAKLIPKKELKKHLAKLKKWRLVSGKYLEKEISFKDFKSAFEYVKKISSVAEKLFHHPQVYFTWGKVRIRIYTHSLGGISGHDFALAKRIDKIK